MSEDLTFAAAIRAAESGSSEGNYQQVKGKVRSARLIGAYGIPGDEWSQMAADVGLEGARWTDPRAQDLVARRVFDTLYRKYGDWRMVAVAWKAGEAVAARVAQDPSLLNEPSLKPVKDYVGQVMRAARDDIEMNQPQMPDGSPVDSGRFQPTMRGLEPTMARPQRNAEETLRGVLTGMRDRLRARVEAEEPEEPVEPTAEPEQQGMVSRVRSALGGDNG